MAGNDSTTEIHTGESEVSEAMVDQIFQKLLPRLNDSLGNTMRSILDEERRTRSPSVQTTTPYIRSQLSEPETRRPPPPPSSCPSSRERRQDNNEEVMSVSVANSLADTAPPFIPPSDMLSSLSGEQLEEEHAGPLRKKHRGDVIITGKVNPGKNTVANCDTNELDKFDMAEEILKQCEMDSSIQEEYNPTINEGLAKRVIKYFKKGAEQAELRKALFKKYKPPSNLEELDTPKMNPGILNLDSVQQYTQRNEAKLYDIHQLLTRATMAVVSIADNALQDEKRFQVVDTTTLVKGCLDAISLLGHSSREMSNRRKNNIKYSLNPQTKELCSADKPTTKFLLGDDISKGAKDAKELSLLAKKTPNKNYHSSAKKAAPARNFTYTGYTKGNANNYNKGNGKSFLAKGRKSQQNYNKKK